jgi:exopolysaccharide biosynthesis polyprenyl glycosylphosphotransferase
MFTRRARLLRLLLVVSDVVPLLLSFEIAYLTRANFPELSVFFLRPGVAAATLATAAVLWTALGFWLAVYRNPESYTNLGMLRLTVTQTFWFGVALATAIYLLKLGDISRLFVAIFIALNFISQIAYRLAARRMRRLVQDGFGGRHYYLIVGTGPKAIELARLIEKNEEQGNGIVGFVQEPDGPAPALGALRREYPVWPLDQLPRMIEEHIVDEILFAVSKAQLERMEEFFLSCEEQGVRTRVLVDFFPHLRSEIALDRLETMPLLTFSNAPENEYLLFLKRGLDLVLACALLVVTAPLMLLIAVLIRLTSPGPVIYRQLRCGLNGRRFWLYKFRSMREDAEGMRPMVEHLNEMDGPVFKSSRDPRMNPVGRVLRRTSLDELPQVLNILRGDMSFVGPRPPLPDEVARYEKWQRRRLRMKPGLTCLWALAGRNQLNFAQWMQLDMEYIDNWSLTLDFKILLRTIPRVLSGRGAS